nr:hypothetical protein CISIN_1g018984mg [Ipomoea batatas]
MVTEILAHFLLKALPGNWHLLAMQYLPWIILDLVFQKVFIAIYLVSTTWLMMSLSITQKLKKIQSCAGCQASSLGNPWAEQLL